MQKILFSIFILSFSYFPVLANEINICISPAWTSGNIEGHESGHGFFTRQGITIIKKEGRHPKYDKMFQEYLEFLTEKSAEPDSTENNFFTFSGHFYDPDTEKNWTGGTTNTALTNFIRHANDALLFFQNNPYSHLSDTDYTEGLHSLAYALHYLEDACVPHHAANYIAFSSWHREFEHYAQTVQEKYKISRGKHPYIPRGNFNNDLREILRNCGIFAKPFVKKTEIVDPEFADVYVESRCYNGQNGQGAPDCDLWDNVIEKTTVETQSRVVQFLDRFFAELK